MVTMMPATTIAKPSKKPRRKHTVPGGRTAFTQITPRDQAVFQALLDYRFLTLEQIARIVPPDPSCQSTTGHIKKLRERLGELFHAEHLHRTKTQHYAGIYALAANGADHLQVGDEDFARVDWLKKNKTASWKFVEHTIELAQFRLDHAEALTRLPAIRLVTGRTLLASIRAVTKPRPSEHPLLIRQPVTLEIFDKRENKLMPVTQVVATVPDTMYLHVLPDQPGQAPDSNQRAGVVEVDRGTEPLKHRGFHDSSIERKIRVYMAARRSPRDTDRWGLKDFRLHFITPNAKRSANIRALARALGADFVWTAEQGSLTATTMLAPVWLDHTDKPQQIVPARFMR
jgi:hypothetical protein